MPEGFFIVAGPEFHRVAAQLREIDPAMPGKFRAAMRKAATPILRDVRVAALSLPARGVKHTGLRARLAKGVGVQVGVGNSARMRITTRMDDPTEAALPRGEDNGIRGWRHPVFGNTDNWVHQPGGSWFRETIADDRDLIEQRLQDVLDEAANTVAHAGIGP